ncbi:hypothetical protein TELCIR_17913, partial [Teladorsagia circumcincta]
KASMPLFAVLLSRVLLKERQSYRLLKESDIHPIRLLAMNSQLAAIMVFPFWLYNDAFTMTRIMGSSDTVYPSPDLWLLCLLAMAGVLSFMQSANVFGMMLSILGVFCYNRVKQEEKVLSHSLPLTRSHTVLSESTLVEMDTSQNGDLMYWASNNRPGYNGSRLGDFEYSDAYQARYDKMDDISKEQHSRRHVRFA